MRKSIQYVPFGYSKSPIKDTFLVLSNCYLGDWIITKIRDKHI